MKRYIMLSALLFAGFLSSTVYSQSEKEEPKGLGLPGDGLDLYAVLDIFQKSKTIEEFEKTLNDEKNKINNLDLNNDKKVDFIKVVTKKDGDDFTFVLQDPINKTETQDVAVILVSKDKDKKVSIQIVGDEDLYGKNYVVEPKGSSTPNPGYTGADKAETKTASSSTTTVVVVETTPVVQYIYSPVYVPYYPPYYFGFYPPYFHPWAPIAYSVYWSNHYHCHAHYYGGYHGNVYINNSRTYVNYNNTRNRAATVNNNIRNGNYRNKSNVSSRPSTRDNMASTRPSTGSGTRPSSGNTASTRPSSGNNMATTRPSTGTSPRASTGTSASTRSSYSSPSTSSRSSSYGGGSRGGMGGGGGMRGGGGRR